MSHVHHFIFQLYISFKLPTDPFISLTDAIIREYPYRHKQLRLFLIFFNHFHALKAVSSYATIVSACRSHVYRQRSCQIISMTDEKSIQAEHVEYIYEESSDKVLKGVSLEVRKGEFVAILGHNGSGKSTLAKLLNALYLPTAGRIIVCGMNTSEDALTLDIRQKAGMIFQNPDNQIVATVVREDVAFGLENMGVPHDEMVRRIDKALEAVHMSERADSAPHMLSGGQKQRVAIAGVLAMEPDIIIADESTAMLDPNGRKEVLDVIHRLNREKGITVVWITHFMEEAAEADRVIVINNGDIALAGTPNEVFSHVDEMHQMHLDVPPMASLANELRNDGMPLPAGILTVDEMTEEVCRLLCPSN